MYCLIYRFKVRKGQDDRFIRSWAEVTEAYCDSCGALGSRLHVSGKEYIAYAQWPSREARETAQLPLPVRNGALAEMRDSCDSIDTLFELTPKADHLRLIRANDA